MMRIIKPEELVVGEFYWCRHKRPYVNGNFAKPSVEPCREDQGHVYLSKNKWWADYALEEYDVYGPIEKPIMWVKGE